MNIDEEKHYVSSEMIKTGGSFIHYLGHALTRADMFNTAKIKDNWQKEWKEYLERGIERSKQ